MPPFNTQGSSRLSLAPFSTSSLSSWIQALHTLKALPPPVPTPPGARTEVLDSRCQERPMPPSEVGGDALLCTSIPCESDQCESVSRGSYLDSMGARFRSRVTVAHQDDRG